MKSLICVLPLLSLTLFACSTSSKITGLSDLPRLPATATGAAIPLKLDLSQSFVGSNGCLLVLRRNEELREFEIAFKSGADVVFAELPPGVYGYRQINCGGTTWDMTFKRWPRFQVFAEKISILDGLSVFLDGNRNMSTRPSNRGASREETLRFFGRIPTESRVKIVSGYTGKAISQTSLEKRARWTNWELRDASDHLIKNPEKDWPSFHACFLGEDEVNALWLGNIQLEVTYENSEQVQSNLSDSWNTFTDHLIGCVQTMVKDFHPRSKARLHYTLFL